MRRIRSQEELLALHTAGDGFIYNDYAQTGASGRQHNVLHRASCPWILRSRATIPKYYAASLREAEGWLDTHRGQEGAGWKRCRNCHTRSEPPQTPPEQTVQRKRTASHYQSTPRELQSVADAPYLVQTKQTTSGKVVEAWSAQRLPYEPRGWLLGFRNDLRAALRPLAAAPDQLLGAVYASEHKGFFDVENVLFYNVGPAFLKGAGRYGVRYERAYQVPLPQQPLAWSAGHYHRYYLDAAAGRPAHWGTGAVLASLHAETRERADLLTAPCSGSS